VIAYSVLNSVPSVPSDLIRTAVNSTSNENTLWELALLQTLYDDSAISTFIGSSTSGIYQNYAPPARTKPYIIFEQISGPRDQTFDGPSGLTTVNIQINSFSTTYAECRSIADAVRRKMDGFEETVSLVGGGTVKILETKLTDEGDIPSERPDATVVYGKRQDYAMVIDERP